MNNQTNKQPNEKNICSSFNDELLLELTVPLVAPGATAFLMLFVFPFFSFVLLKLFLLLRASQAWLCGSR